MGDYSLQITPEAEADIDDAYEYIAYHSDAEWQHDKGKGFEMTRWEAARNMFRDVAIALLVVGYAACPIHRFVSCRISGVLGTGQFLIEVLVALAAIVFRCWGILTAAVVLFFVSSMFCH